MNKKTLIIIVAIIVIVSFIAISRTKVTTAPPSNSTQSSKQIVAGSFDTSKFKTDEEWRKILSVEQFHILRESGTEVPFTGDLTAEKRKGIYYSVGCDIPLFRSEQKFDSGTGWPSFWETVQPDSVVLRKENEGDDRIEVLDRCGNHLGHVFDDGPPPTGKRYCMNSVALRFVPDSE